MAPLRALAGRSDLAEPIGEPLDPADPIGDVMASRSVRPR